MGMSGTATVAYGFQLGHEDDIESEQVIALLKEWNDTWPSPKWPVEVVTYGYTDGPNYFLAVQGYEDSTCDWGETIGLPARSPSEDELVAARAFCEERGVPWPAYVGWRVMASYG